MILALVLRRRPTPRLAIQLLLPIVVLVLAFLAVAALYWSQAFERLYVGALTERLEAEIRLLAKSLPWDEAGPSLDRICRRHAEDIEGRVTVIASDGAVLGESHSDSAVMENHGRRPEIREAGDGGVGTSIRYSHTIGERLLYVALLDRRDGRERFVRLALPLYALREGREVVRSILAWGFLAAIGIGGGLAWLFSRRILDRVRRIETQSRRIAAGDAGARPATEIPSAADELGAVERNLVSVAGELRDRLAAVEGERSKLEVVLQNMADGVVVLDAEGRIQLCNDSATALLAIPRDAETMAARLVVLCRNPDVDALVEEVLRDGAAGVQREVVLTGAETTRTMLVSGAPLPEKKGPHGAILVFHDVTRVRQLETMRADFVANVSHELRTPLTAIRGYAETLLHGALDQRERAIHFLGVIDRQARRLARLIDDLLSLSDLELGRVELHRHPVSVASLIESVFEMLRPQADARRVELVVEVARGVPRIPADRDRMEEVLINLVDNAIKYGGEGKTVAVRAVADEDRRFVEIAVADQGVGIPEADIPRLTERFYRVDKARSRELGGTGLGLAIVKHIVQAHGGELRIESRINVGTTVTIRLPVAEETHV